jgi:tetratricopeptide (TPR) repeat protein
MPSDQQFTCPVLIGRAAQLDALLRLVERAHSGHGHVALIAGEAGVGKSRMVTEARARVTNAGMRVLQGQCFEQDRTFPYAPLVDLLRSYWALTSEETLRHETGASAPLLIKLLPELSAHLPRSALALDPEQEKRLLFQALLRFFADLTTTLTRPAILAGVRVSGEPPKPLDGAALRPPLAKQPDGTPERASLLVILEDMHWSDDTSLEFLLQLARRIATQPILVLVTYRSDEVQPPLRHALANLERERLASEIVLNRLSASETDAMLRAIPGLTRAVRSELGRSVYALTDGNPFFIEEVAASLTGHGRIGPAASVSDPSEMSPVEGRRPLVSDQHIPDSVRDAVQGRIATLSGPARELLVPAAVAGRRFDFDLLQVLTQRSEDDLLASIKELAAAQLVVEESADRFAFRHALTREAIYASLLARERIRWHRAIADALERIGVGMPGVRLGDLAYHAAESGSWLKALGWAQQAGEQAQRFYAPHEAVEHFSGALDAARRIEWEPGALAGGRQIARLHRARGQTYEILGEFEHASDDFQQALERSRAGRDRTGEWQALMDLGALWAARDYAAAGVYFRQALEQARALGEAPTIAQTLNRIGNWHLNNERPAEAQRYHLEALAIFEAAADRPGLAATLDLLGMTSYLGGNLAQGAAYHRRALGLYQEMGDRQGLVACLAPQALQGSTAQTDTMVVAAPNLRTLVPLAERGLQLAREMSWRPGEVFCLFNFAFLLSALGDYEQALRMASDGLAIAVDIEHRQWMTALHATIGAIYLDLLALTAARQHLETALALAHEIRSLHWVHAATGFLASAYIVQAQTEAAGGTPSPSAEFAEGVVSRKVPASLDAGTAVPAVGDRGPAGAPLLERAASILANVQNDGSDPQTLGQRLLWCARVELMLARGRPGEALGLVDQFLAADPNVAPDRPILRLAKLRGEALTMLGRPAEAEPELLVAQSLAAVQGARGVLWRVHVTLGNLRRAQGRAADAEQEYAEARQLIAELAAPLTQALLGEHFTEAALARIPAAHVPTPRQAAKQAFGGLTTREREVAALITQGKSNREIAETLVLGERTIETHVGNILSKLGFSSRSQIAAWVTERNLGQRS